METNRLVFPSDPVVRFGLPTEAGFGLPACFLRHKGNALIRDGTEVVFPQLAVAQSKYFKRTI